MLRRFEKNSSVWEITAKAARQWMMKADADYPIYHLVAPEGWINDPNGVTFDPTSNLYHRFYQYDKTWNEDCMHGNVKNCSAFSFDGANRNTRTWGHTVSRDLVHWADWPGIDSDSEWDNVAVWSGNCVIADTGNPVCIYSGGKNKACDTGVCATSSDWIHWKKSGCMQVAPSPRSQTNHDSSIYRIANGTYYLLSGGCTYNGTNDPQGGALPCTGNAQVWRSSDLSNWRYVKPLTKKGGPGNYWELPYLLPFDFEGNPLRNDQIDPIVFDSSSARLPAVQQQYYALLFGLGNAYFGGSFDSQTETFTPTTKIRYLDGRRYYSFNPHATDVKNNRTRRIMFGWVMGDTSQAVKDKKVPYWQSAHSIARMLTLNVSANLSTVYQSPLPELEFLRDDSSTPIVYNDITIQGDEVTRLDKGIGSDAVYMSLTFESLDTNSNTTCFGIRTRLWKNYSCNITYSFKDNAIAVGDASQTWPLLSSQPKRTGTIEIFLDRSIVEVFFEGSALTGRCMLPTSFDVKSSQTTLLDQAEMFSNGGSIYIKKLEVWQMQTMW
eukprot:g3308.t1